MKKGFNILLILCAALFVISCDKTKSYTDMLNAEKKAIDRLIDKEGIQVLSDYPSSGVFKENQFVKLDNGVYLNVVDSGNGDRAALYKTTILCRFSGHFFMDDTTSYDNFRTNTWPVEFKYGMYTAIDSNPFNTFLCEGLGTPLAYVGDSSIVKLIIPFKVNSQSFQSSGIPTYFSKVRYIFDK